MRFYRCWKQYIMSIQKMSRLQRKELFSVILCFESLKSVHYRRISEYVCRLHAKHPPYVLNQSVMVVEEITVERRQCNVVFVESNTSRQLVKLPSQKEMFYSMII